jgi:hypothetical protein
MIKNSNLITLRKRAKKSFVLSVSNNSKNVSKNYYFLKNFIYLLRKKGYWVFKTHFSETKNINKILLHVLVTNRQIQKIEKKKVIMTPSEYRLRTNFLQKKRKEIRFELNKARKNTLRIARLKRIKVSQRKRKAMKFDVAKELQIRLKKELDIYDSIDHSKEITEEDARITEKYRYKNPRFMNFLKRQLGNINYIIKIKVLNNQLKRGISSRLRSILKKYKFRLFKRQINLFFDTVHTLNLYYQGLTHVSSVLLVFSNVFKYLKKRLHKFFFEFLNTVFRFFLNYRRRPRITHIRLILGLKFRINGRLFGKRRASTSVIMMGVLPNQAIEKDIEYSAIDTFTRYGAYGMHMWVNKVLKENEKEDVYSKEKAI